MKYACEMIQDLLPLYHDEVCSAASRDAVEEHLQECSECRQIAEKLKNHDVDKLLTQEKDSVIKNHEKQERKKTYIIGIVTSCVLFVPTLICLICNLAIGHALDWFFIVLAAMLLVASVLVVPFLAPREKGLATILSFVGALLLLLLVCCIYTKGDWFAVAAIPVVFGLSVPFAPYVVSHMKLPENMQNHKGSIVMVWDTFWLYGIIVACGFYINKTYYGDIDYSYWKLALPITTYCVLIVWVIFFLVRYIRINVLIKVGIGIISSGIWTAFANDVISVLSGIPADSGGIFHADLSKGFYSGDLQVLNGNIMLVILLISIVVGGVFILLGLLQGKEKD